ncbi:MAG: WYL domain-containing protein [Verrucomicrobiales bacterium]|nr:WYL domain-containing protein [Verrucomicrobiales bacterium]
MQRHPARTATAGRWRIHRIPLFDPCRDLFEVAHLASLDEREEVLDRLRRLFHDADQNFSFVHRARQPTPHEYALAKLPSLSKSQSTSVRPIDHTSRRFTFHLTRCGGRAIGYDPDRKARRTFALQRIRKARPVKFRFLRPADFSLKDHLGGSFGVWHSPTDGGKRQRIRIRFTGWAARLV